VRRMYAADNPMQFVSLWFLRSLIQLTRAPLLSRQLWPRDYAFRQVENEFPLKIDVLLIHVACSILDVEKVDATRRASCLNFMKCLLCLLRCCRITL
jgi:hypothetical protein